MTKTNGKLKRFKRAAAQSSFQSTFQITPKNVPLLAHAIVSSLRPVEGCQITINEVVFTPNCLNALLARLSILQNEMDSTRYLHDWTLAADGEADVETLLETVLTDAIDFAFTPMPKKFILYASHDGLATFFAARKSFLNPITGAFTSLGMKPMEYNCQF